MTKAPHLPPPQHKLPATPSVISLLLNELKDLRLEHAKTNGELKELREQSRTCMYHPEGHKAAPPIQYRQPNVFSGKRDIYSVYEWVHNMNDYFNLTKMPEADRLAFASTYFDGDARIWFDHTYRDHSDDPSWEKFKAEFVMYWKPWNYKFELWHQWNNIVVTSTVKNFANDLRNLKNKINLFSPANALSEDDLLDRFLQGITHLNDFSDASYVDFDTAVVAADRVDQENREKIRKAKLQRRLIMTHGPESLNGENY